MIRSANTWIFASTLWDAVLVMDGKTSDNIVPVNDVIERDIKDTNTNAKSITIKMVVTNILPLMLLFAFTFQSSCALMFLTFFYL